MSESIQDTLLRQEVAAGRKLFVELRTPEHAVYSGGATSVLLPGAKGAMGILPRHAPLLSSLDVGYVRIRDPLGKEWRFVCGLGFVEVQKNRVLVLVDFADDVNDIDVARAEAALKRAKERLRAPTADVDMVRAEAALQRATMRLRYAASR